MEVGTPAAASNRRREALRRPWTAAALITFATLASAPGFGQQAPASAPVHTVNQSVEVYVSGKTIQAQYLRELRIEDVAPVEASVGVFYNEQRDLVGIADALMYLGDQAQQRQIEVSVGTRVSAAFLNQENEDTLGVGIGGEAEWFFSKQHRASLKLSLFYAPDILTFGIANDIKDYALRVQTRVGDHSIAFVGYRSLDIETTSGNRKLDDGVHIGFRWSF